MKQPMYPTKYSHYFSFLGSQDVFIKAETLISSPISHPSSPSYPSSSLILHTRTCACMIRVCELCRVESKNERAMIKEGKVEVPEKEGKRKGNDSGFKDSD